MACVRRRGSLAARLALAGLALGATRASALAHGGGTPARVEHFVLERPDADLSQAAPKPIAWVEWRADVLEHGRQLQCDVRFEDGERVLHVERLTASGARLVWREIGERSGRSLSVEWARDGRGLSTFEWGRDGARRGRLVGGDAVVMPLYLVELARSGAATQGRYATFDPLARRLEPLTLTTSYELGLVRALSAAAAPEPSAPADGPSELRRAIELVRADGTSAGHYVFEGEELVTFRWQAGGLRARRVAPEIHAAAVAELELRTPVR